MLLQPPAAVFSTFWWRALGGDAGSHSGTRGRVFMEKLLSKIKKKSHLFEAALIPPTRCQILPYVC